MGWNYLYIPKLQLLQHCSVGIDKQFHYTFYNGCNYLSLLGVLLRIWQYTFTEKKPTFSSRIISCDQAALLMVQCDRPSVYPSVCPSHLIQYVPIIVSSQNFQGLLPLTYERSVQKVKVIDQRSRSQPFRDHILDPVVFQGHLSNFKVTRNKKSPIVTQIGHFRNVTQVWIHQWLWNDSQSLK